MWSSGLGAVAAVKPVDPVAGRPTWAVAATNFKRSSAMSSLRRAPQEQFPASIEPMLPELERALK